MYVAKRSHHNPILVPDRDHYWESFATFNMCPIKVGRKYFGLYRAISEKDSFRKPEQISIIGITESKDGDHFEKRAQFIVPEKEWEQFGCEDPRVTFFEGKYYIFYTALSTYPFGPEGIKVAVAVSSDMKSIKERHLVTPFNAKAMTLFPERINGKVVVIFSAHTDLPPAKIAIAEADSIEEFWSPEFWEKWHSEMDKHTIDLRRTEFDHVEIGAPPIRTKDGWLLVYSYIQNYFPNPNHFERAFGIEALLFDLKNPKKIIGHTGGPILVPEESYELSGYVANIVFPSGALVHEDILHIYYGAADTTSCRMSVNLNDLISSMTDEMTDSTGLKRFPKNPILSPVKEHRWESQAVFNAAAIHLEGKTHILYRALSDDNTSTIGYATTKDGFKIDERLSEPIYLPRESFEIKKINNANSGCEDPRLTKIGKEIYMCYTAYDGIGPPRVAVTSIKEKDFLNKKWNWTKPTLITPKDVDDKDACLFPEKVEGKHFVLHRVGTDICGDFLDSLDFNIEKINKCIKIIGPRIGTWDSAKVGISAPPIKTKDGWLLLYHGVSKNHHTYRVGAVLLDLKDPTEVISRMTDPIFEPVEEYEKVGVVNNVVFPCGMVVKGKILYVYYGGADRVIGVATIKVDDLLGVLKRGAKLNFTEHWY